MKLSREQAKAHNAACKLLEKERLNYEERYQVLRDWRAGATHINTLAAAHFTPLDLARGLCIEVSYGRVIDLCAGIGALSFFAYEKIADDPRHELVCVEIDPYYVAVGRKVVPQATWICADVLNLRKILAKLRPEHQRFTFAIGNSPFGSTSRTGRAPRYHGNHFEYHVIDIASDIADYGAFVVPQESAPSLRGGQHYSKARTQVQPEQYRNFKELTGIELTLSCCVDTSCHDAEWLDVKVRTEVVRANFVEARERRSVGRSIDMFQ